MDFNFTDILSKIDFGKVFNLAGSITASEGQQQQGADAYAATQRQKIARQFEAEQATINAGQAIASAQKDAEEERRQTKMVTSRIIAVAAASGAGASDPTIINMIANQAGYGALKAATALYQGEDKSRQLRMVAAGKKYEAGMAELGGIAQKNASGVEANATLLKGVGQLFFG